MNINVIFSDGVGKVQVEGTIDAVSTPVFHNELVTINFDGIDRIDMDFAHVSYISSMALRELLMLKKRLGNKPLRIENVQPVVDEIFRVTGFDSFLEYTVLETTMDYNHMSFKEFLAHKVAHAPVKTIIASEDDAYNWLEIDECSQIIANDLEKLGAGRGSHVAICGANSINWVLTFYAIQKLGAIAVLVNSNLSASEIVKLSGIGDITAFCYGEIPAMQNEDEFLSEVQGEGSKITSVYDIRKNNSFKARLSEYAGVSGKFEAKVDMDSAAVIIFTSGSTGVPKGVLLSAYNILNAAFSNVHSLGLTQEDRACLILPLFHIFGLVAGLFANAIADATMLMPERIKAEDIIRVVSENQCTVFHSVPTMLFSILNNQNFEPRKMESLRSTILSGAPISESQMLMLLEKFPHNHFATSYGLSEMAPVTITDYEDSVKHITKTVGKPIPGVEVRIFNNEAEKICETGVSGEIQVYGYSLMTCYYKEDLDAQPIDEAGWLHTGDLGFFDEDGYLYFVGTD